MNLFTVHNVQPAAGNVPCIATLHLDGGKVGIISHHPAGSTCIDWRDDQAAKTFAAAARQSRKRADELLAEMTENARMITVMRKRLLKTLKSKIVFLTGEKVGTAPLADRLATKREYPRAKIIGEDITVEAALPVFAAYYSGGGKTAKAATPDPAPVVVETAPKRKRPVKIDAPRTASGQLSRSKAAIAARAAAKAAEKQA